jgi:TIGR03009 family protein
MAWYHMRSNIHRLAAILAWAAATFVASDARGQTNSGAKTDGQQPPAGARSAPRPSAQATSGASSQGAAPRAQSDPPAGGGKTLARGAAAAPGQAGAPAPAPAGPRPPFTITESQQKLLDQILIKWEKQSDKVKTFTCNFTRWEYDPTFGPKAYEYQKTEGEGQIKYASPDRGEFAITKLLQFDPAKNNYVATKDALEHWLCDGKAIYEFNLQKKQLIEHRLPPELQGKAISDGPLPFIFGAKVEQLKRRYWMRDITPNDQVGKTIWLEAAPMRQQDAANFQRATVVLSEPDFMPFAMRIVLPGANPDKAANTAYQFDNPKVNGLLANWVFTAPRLTPAQVVTGWKHVIEKDPVEELKNARPPAGEPSQAKRTVPAVGRK